MYLMARWLGGLLTNFDAVKKTIEKLSVLEDKLKGAEESGYTKKEQLLMKREIDKLTRFIGGIRNLDKLPNALFIVDSRREEIAVREATKMAIPVVALVDTNGDPTKVTYPIAANDDAIKSISILVGAIADAYDEGKKIWEKKTEEVRKETEETKEPVTV